MSKPILYCSGTIAHGKIEVDYKCTTKNGKYFFTVEHKNKEIHAEELWFKPTINQIREGAGQMALNMQPEEKKEEQKKS